MASQDLDSDSIESELAEEVALCYDDPLRFVMLVYDWGVPGTSLEKYTSPDAWQIELLNTIGDEIKARKFNGHDPVEPIRIAISSGHGVGKSAVVAWLIQFIIATRPHCRGVITSGTYPQLRDKTWSELGKWHNMSLIKHWFTYSNSRGNLSYVKTNAENSWNCIGTASTEHNADAFAGLHCAHSTPFYIFDEASAVPAKIFEVAQGGLTDGEPFIILTGNATKNSGGFIDAVKNVSGRWIVRCVDSRNARMTNKTLIEQWRRDWGEDSDFFRVRVRGLPPHASSNQLIAFDIVDNARRNKLLPDEYQFVPIVIGVDVARMGLDESVITVRQGRKIHVQKVYRNLDNIQLALQIANTYSEYDNVTALLVDETGVGSGVVDYLRHLGYPVVGVIAGSEADDKKKYYNKRAEMWVKCKEWLAQGNCEIPDDQLLVDQLTGQEFYFDEKDRYRMVSKDDATTVGFNSPDRADSIVNTFAYPVNYLQQQNSFEPIDILV